jgi:hypothetical protein
MPEEMGHHVLDDEMLIDLNIRAFFPQSIKVIFLDW